MYYFFLNVSQKILALIYSLCCWKLVLKVLETQDT